LFIFVEGEGLRRPQLKEDAEEEEDEVSNEHSTLSKNVETFQVHQNRIANEHIKRYKCHTCEPPTCLNPTTCTDAIQCWTSRVRESSGSLEISAKTSVIIVFVGQESVMRGCTKETEQLPLICQTPSFSGQQKRQASGQFQVDCCIGDFCNSGDFPELPPLYTKNVTVQSDSMDYALKMTAAILGPVVVIGTLGEQISFMKVIPTRVGNNKRLKCTILKLKHSF
jgi:activin receptor type-1